jgi:hypothetical protein
LYKAALCVVGASPPAAVWTRKLTKIVRVQLARRKASIRGIPPPMGVPHSTISQGQYNRVIRNAFQWISQLNEEIVLFDPRLSKFGERD